MNVVLVAIASAFLAASDPLPAPHEPMARKRGSQGPAGGDRGVDDDAARELARRVVRLLIAMKVVRPRPKRPGR